MALNSLFCADVPLSNYSLTPAAVSSCLIIWLIAIPFLVLFSIIIIIIIINYIINHTHSATISQIPEKSFPKSDPGKGVQFVYFSNVDVLLPTIYG